MHVTAIQSRTVFNFTVEDSQSLPSFNIHLGMPVPLMWWYIVVTSNPQSTEQPFVTVPLVLADSGLKQVSSDLRFYTRCFQVAKTSTVNGS